MSASLSVGKLQVSELHALPINGVPQTHSDPLLHILTAGVSDPFNSFCVNSPRDEQQILNHAIHGQWSLFAPTPKDEDLTLVKQNVMSYAIHEPVSYYALLYAGACHKHFWQSFTRKTNYDTELLRLKGHAIKALRKAIQQYDQATEDILIAALMLSAHDSGDRARRVPFGKVMRRKSLLYTLDAEFYCALDVEWKHLEVFYDLLERRGGIFAMRPGVMQTAAILYVSTLRLMLADDRRFDIFNAFMHLFKPRIAAILPLEATLTMRNWTQDDEAQILASKVGTGFEDVFASMSDCSESARLQRVIRGFVNLIVDFDQLCRDLPKHSTNIGTPNERTVIWIRSMLIHELLTLPAFLSKEEEETDEGSTLVYELCRLSCLMVCQAWAFADNNSRRSMARRQVLKLIPLLKRAVAGGTISLSSELPSFYTWLIALGLMLAYEDFDISGDDACIRAIVPFLAKCIVKARPEAWSAVSSIMSGFLWLWKDCEITGKEAWDCGCRLMVSS